ncbi:MAG: cytochrome c oxidase assembly protein [Thermodesulfobacteriota bacterium]
MNILHFLGSAWSFEPWVILFALALFGAYTLLPGSRLNRKSLLFSSGVMLMVIALVSPLDHLGRNYLFSAHMVQHILLLLVIPLMLLSGIPEAAAERALNSPYAGGLIKFLGNPVPAWLLGVGSMWVWHMPSLHDIVMANEGLYIAQQISFVLIGVIFWWPVFAPVKTARLSPLPAALYLASACLGCSILGMLITFAGAGLYTAYANPADSAGILSYIRNELCITPGVDQQIGGLTMWVPGCLIYLAASMVTVARWYASPEPGSVNTCTAESEVTTDLKLKEATERE